MPEVKASVEFLAKLPLYGTEKPYLLLPSKEQKLDPDKVRLHNLEFECHDAITIKDMRECKEDLNIDLCGFEFYQHTSSILQFHVPTNVDDYKVETQELLKVRFGAVKVLTYEARLRKNQEFRRKEFDVYDKLLVEGPAKGAHNGKLALGAWVTADIVDVTYTSGPNIIQRYLPTEDQDRFLRPGFRIRIFNTWRPLNKVLEDRPLALCDSRSVAPHDLVAADRILPDRVGEVYYLQYNPQQQWYWLEEQTNAEPFIFLMYDTKSSGNGARFCPHVSFDNPNKPGDAEPRSSIETRSIVITADG